MRLKEAGVVDLSALTTRAEKPKAAAAGPNADKGAEAKRKADKTTKAEVGKAGDKAKTTKK